MANYSLYSKPLISLSGSPVYNIKALNFVTINGQCVPYFSLKTNPELYLQLKHYRPNIFIPQHFVSWSNCDNVRVFRIIQVFLAFIHFSTVILCFQNSVGFPNPRFACIHTLFYRNLVFSE